MTYLISKIDQWTPGDTIEVAGTLCRNPNEALITHISAFYAYSDDPIRPAKDAREIIGSGWLESMPEDELIEFIEDNEDEIK